MPKAYGYCRLSKDETTVKCKVCSAEWTLQIKDVEQTEYDCPHCGHTHHIDSGHPTSIQAQMNKCLTLAHEHLPRSVDENIEIMADINISGSIPIRDRPKGGELYQKLVSGDYLIIPKLDRGWRNIGDFCNQLEFYREKGIKLILGDFPMLEINSPLGTMILQMLAVFAQFEREMIRERTKTALSQKKQNNEPHGHSPPRGYQLRCKKCDHSWTNAEYKNGKFCPACKCPRNGNTYHAKDPQEQFIMWRLLWERSGHHYKDWDLIAYDLNLDGYTTRERRKITQKYCRNYFEDAAKLFYRGELDLKYRPPKMENFSLHSLLHIPASVKTLMAKNSDQDEAAA